MKKQLIISAFVIALIGCNNSAEQTESSSSPTDSTALYVRKNANTPAAQADLEAYAKGVAAMKALPCSDNRSWYYWGAMHHIPDLSDMGSGYDTLCPSYGKTFGPPVAWNNCPHMLPAKEQLHFLVWHRLYTWYFERMIRKFSGKKDFAMPYWNYNNPNQRMMPAAFRQPASWDSNALWEAGRSRWLTAGNAIRSNDSDAVVANINGMVTVISTDPMGIILDTASLWTANSFALFSQETEDMPHNCMHDYIGGAVDAMDTKAAIYNRIYQQNTTSLQGLMADVPSAGFDPIFFMHHANIDRLFMNWEMDFPAEALTLDEFNEAGMWTYNFIDENGNEIHYSSLQQVFDSIRSIDYTYDYMVGSKPKQLAATKKAGWNAGNIIASVSPKRKLNTPNDNFSLNFGKALTAAKPGGDVIYALEVEISVANPTDNFIVVMVDANDETPISADVKKHVAGIAGLFGVQKHQGNDKHGHTGNRILKTMTYDINDELARQNGFDDKGITVYLHQLRPDKNNPIYIENIRVKEIGRKQ